MCETKLCKTLLGISCCWSVFGYRAIAFLKYDCHATAFFSCAAECVIAVGFVVLFI